MEDGGMSEKEIEFRRLARIAHAYLKAPPAMTIIGLPALPGESWSEYHRRALAAVKPIDDQP